MQESYNDIGGLTMYSRSMKGSFTATTWTSGCSREARITSRPIRPNLQEQHREVSHIAENKLTAHEQEESEHRIKSSTLPINPDLYHCEIVSAVFFLYLKINNYGSAKGNVE